MPLGRLVIVGVALLSVGAAFAASGSVSNDITPRDKIALHHLNLPANSINSTALSLREQVELIRSVQAKILDAAPRDEGIPERARRDLLEVIKRGHGLCFDRSRSIETALRGLGFETRHVSIYSTAERSAALALATPKTPSHAVSEVKTKAGWMLVDSNVRWIGFKDGRVLNAGDIRSLPKPTRAAWSSDPNGLHEIFTEDFVFLYGLYSRHGQFYAPYTIAPDINYQELLHNF